MASLQPRTRKRARSPDASSSVPASRARLSSPTRVGQRAQAYEAPCCNPARAARPASPPQTPQRKAVQQTPPPPSPPRTDSSCADVKAATKALRSSTREIVTRGKLSPSLAASIAQTLDSLSHSSLIDSGRPGSVAVSKNWQQASLFPSIIDADNTRNGSYVPSQAYPTTTFDFSKLCPELRELVYGQIFYNQRHALRAKVGASYASGDSSSKHSRGDPYTAVIKPLKDGSHRMVDESGMLTVNKQYGGEYGVRLELEVWSKDAEFFSLVHNFNFDGVSTFLSSLNRDQIRRINEGRGKHANFTLVLGFTPVGEMCASNLEWNPSWEMPKGCSQEECEKALERWTDYRKADTDSNPQEMLEEVEGSNLDLEGDPHYKDDYQWWADSRHHIEPGEAYERTDFHALSNSKLPSWNGQVDIDYAINLDLAPQSNDIDKLFQDCGDHDLLEVHEQRNQSVDPEDQQLARQLDTYGRSGRAVVNRSKKIARFRYGTGRRLA